MALSDAQLVHMALEGDGSAFDELVSRYRSRIYYVALSKVRSSETALDLAQDAFVQAYLSLRMLKEPEKFGSWLAAIASNLCLMYLRQAKEIAVSDDVLDSLGGCGDASRDAGIDSMMIRDALDSLPDGTRSAAVLFFVEEMKQKEIAEFLGISIHAVKSRVRDARTNLQKEMIGMIKRNEKKSDVDFNRGLRHKMELARWYRELADLINNGVPIMCAFDMMRKQGFSNGITDATVRLMDSVQAGSTMSDAIGELPALQTPQAAGMIHAGEIGGVLDWTSQFLADWIEIENGQMELELAFWCRTLGSILCAGVDVKLALETSLDIAGGKELRRAIHDIADSIDANLPLEPVLLKHSDVLLPIVQVSILAGEKAGILGYTLQWAANAVHARMSLRFFGQEFQPPVSPSSAWVTEFASAAPDYLRSESPAIRVAAVTILGRLRADNETERIAALLSDDSAEVRRAAIRALSEMGCRQACHKMLELLSDTDSSVRRAVLDAMAGLELHDTAPDIAKMIADPDTRVASTAVKALEALGEIDTLTGSAIKLLDVEQKSTDRVRAAHILLAHPVPDAADALVRALDDEIANVAFTSAQVLAHLKRTEAVPVLARFLAYPGFMQKQAVDALVKIGDPSAAGYIRKAISEGGLDPIYVWAAEKLE